MVAGFHRVLAVMKKKQVLAIIFASEWRLLIEKRKALLIRKRVEAAAVGRDLDFQYPNITPRQLMRRLRLRRPAIVVAVVSRVVEPQQQPPQAPQQQQRGEAKKLKRRERQRLRRRRMRAERCAICLNRINEAGKADGCLHRCCYACYKTYAETRVENGLPPACPYCRKEFRTI